MHHRRAGYPFGTLVDFATDGAGMPIFCLSPLAIHARNLIEDSRCSLVVQMPGWTGLANARVTIFGDVFQLPPDMQVCLDCSDCLDWGGVGDFRTCYVASGPFGGAGCGGRPLSAWADARRGWQGSRRIMEETAAAGLGLCLVCMPVCCALCWSSPSHSRRRKQTLRARLLLATSLKRALSRRPSWGSHPTQAEAREIFLAKQANERKERWVLGSFLFFRWGTAGVGGRPPVAGLG
jgi:hypothetical protein